MAGFTPVALLWADDLANEQDGSVEHSASPASGAELPILSLSNSVRWRHDRRYARLPVVVADAGDGVAFRSLAPRVAAAINPAQRLLHPAFLADYLEHDLSRNVVAYGFPGSGNVIIQKIMTTLLAPYRAGRFDQLEWWCASGHLALCDILRDAMSEVGFSEVAIGYGQPGYLTVNAAMGGKQVPRIYLPQVPSKISWADAVYGTHSPPLREDVQRLRRAGGHAVIVARHPFDAIVSMVAKHSTTISFEELMAEEGCTFAEARNIATKRTLRRDSVLLPVAYECKAFLRAASKFVSTIPVVRYEDLMADPAGFIRDVATILQVDAPAETIAELSNLVGTANLGPALHLNQAGVGHWREQLDRAQLAKIGDSGLLPYARILGYDDVEPSPLARGAVAQGLVPSALSSFSHMYYLEDAEVCDRVRRHHVMTGVGGLAVTSETPELIEIWRKKIDSDIALRQITRCMSLQ